MTEIVRSHRVIHYINLISLLWAKDADYRLPCDFLNYNILVNAIDKNEDSRG